MRYPFRPQFAQDVGWQAALLYNGDPTLNAVLMGNPSSKTFDDRQVLRPLFGLNNVLLDPLTKKIDLEDMAVKKGYRGEVDLNYAYADGSVRRYNGVKYRDERMRFVPQNSHETRAINNTWAETLPPP